MSHYDIGIIPDESDLRFGVRGNNLVSGIPALQVARHITIQFRPEDHEFAVRYLTKIADEARALASKVAEARS